jgi:hypothetical protein
VISLPESVLLTDEERALLVKVSSLLEEAVETFSILEDKEAMSCLKQADEDVKAGRVRDCGDFLKELKKLAKYKLQVTRTFEKSFRKLDIQTKRRADSTIRRVPSLV